MSLAKKNRVMFPSFMDEFFAPDWFGGTENFTATLPAVNIIENEAGFELELAAPGLKKENFKIEIDNDVLTVSADVKKVENKIMNKFTHKEFAHASFK